MRVLVHIRNLSQEDQLIISDNPLQYLTCKAQMKNGRALPAVPVDSIKEKLGSLKIAPGKTVAQSAYLNNYNTFDSEGEFSIEWKVTLPVLHNKAVSPLDDGGSFRAKIVKVPDEEISKVFEREIEVLRLANDPQTKRDAIEGIASVRSPAVIPFLQRCLTFPDCETRIIFTLANRWPDDKTAVAVMNDYLRTGTNATALHLAFGSAIAQRRLLPDDALQRLIKSQDPTIYDCAIQYIRATVGALRLELIDNSVLKEPTRKTITQPLYDYLKSILSEAKIVPDGKSGAGDF